MPAAHTPPPPPNFRKFGLGLPTPKQAQAQPRLLASLLEPDLHCSLSRRPPTKTRFSRSGPLLARGPGLRVTHWPRVQPLGSPRKGRHDSGALLQSAAHLSLARTRPMPHFASRGRPQPRQDPARPRARPARLLARPSEHLAWLVLLQAAEAPHYQAL